MAPAHIPATLLLHRIKDVKKLLGTVTDKLHLNKSEAMQLPDFYPSDLTLFRQIIESGKAKSAEFRSPHGYKILDFLTMLCYMQEAQREAELQAERDELNRLFKLMTPEAQANVKAWAQRPKVRISFKQTVQLTFNAWLDGYKVGDRVTNAKTGETVEIVTIDRTVCPSKALTVKGESTYILHPMNIKV